MCTSEAPASYAWWVLSTCSDGVTGTAGLFFLRGTEPVMATATIIGCIESSLNSDVQKHRLPTSLRAGRLVDRNAPAELRLHLQPSRSQRARRSAPRRMPSPPEAHRIHGSSRNPARIARPG